MTYKAVAHKITPKNSQDQGKDHATTIREILSQRNVYGLDISSSWLEKVFAIYQQPHRYFHTLEHLRDICVGIRNNAWDDPVLASELLLTALFHDVIWYPQSPVNEMRSAEAFDYVMAQAGNPIPPDAAERVRQAILATSDQSSITKLAMTFNDFDCNVLIHGSPVDLLAYEFQIFREFQYLNVTEYRKGRGAFFKRFAQRFPKCRKAMDFLVEYLERRRPRVGIYAGTFNPFHIGHFSILEKAEQMFDKVIVAVGINPQKHTGKDLNLAKTLPFHEVISFDTLMVDLIQKESVLCDVTLVRGLRNGYDLDYEMNQLCFMQEMWPATQSVYIPCDKNLEHISSSALKGLSIFDVRGRDYMYYPHKYDYFTKSIKELFE